MKSLYLLTLLVFGCLCAAGQPVTMTGVAQARDLAARAPGLTDVEKSEISGLYDQASQLLQQEVRWKAQVVGQTRTQSVIASELETARAAAMMPVPVPLPPPPSETTLQVEDELTRVRSDRTSRIKRREELAKLLVSLSKRRDEITARRAEIRERLQSIEDEVTVLSLASASPQWEQASRMMLGASRQALEQELLALGTERNALDLRKQVIPLQREAFLLKLEADELLLDDLRIRRSRARLQDARKSLEATLKQTNEIVARFPQLAPIAEQIRDRAQSLWGANGVQERSDAAVVISEEMGLSLARFKEITADTKRRFMNSALYAPASDWWPPRVEKFGKPAEVGILSIGYAAAEAVARRQVFKLEEERSVASALETRLQQVLAETGKNPQDADYGDFRTQTRMLLQLKRDVLVEFLSTSREYLNRLSHAQRVSMELLGAIQELKSFVLERVLWSRSVNGSMLPAPRDIANALLWFVSPKSWSQIFADFFEAGHQLWFWITGLLGSLLLFRFRGLFRDRIKKFESRKSKLQHIRRLFLDILLALLWALPGPLTIAYLGWMLRELAGEVDLGRALAAGAFNASRFLYGMLLLRNMLADGGALDRIAGWSEAVRELLDWAVNGLKVLYTPLLFVFAALAEDGMYFNGDQALQAHHDSLGRLCFIASVCVLLLIGRRLLRANSAVSNALGIRKHRQGFAGGRLSRIVLNLVCGFSILLAVLGFYTTAYMLAQNALRTVALTIVLALFAALVRQWRLDQETNVSGSRSVQERKKALQADQQVSSLSHFGLTLVWIVGASIIWSAATPALALVRRVELLPEFRLNAERNVVEEGGVPVKELPKEVKQNAPTASSPMLPIPMPGKPAEPAQVVQRVEPLYLTDVFLAIFVGIMAFMLVKNIPGLLQFTVFQRVELDEGGQYAANTISRYLVIMLALVILSGVLGVNWSKVQWLAAALTFGIGFGLQEIFANFAAGLILLFDRSIRVGDAVTVGTLSGIVSRIQMRATTVTLWDRSDMIVPNKEFITSKLVNWTLSNPETRVDLKVGVDYGSDVEMVREVLLKVANEHPAVLAYPEAQVLLTEFGSSAIHFELRVFGLYSYGRPVLLDELYRAVMKEFRRLGIVIAFPQLDIRVNPVPAVVPALEQGSGQQQVGQSDQ